MFKKMRKLFNISGHSIQEDSSLESVPVNSVDLPNPEHKEELPVVPGPIMQLSRNGNAIGRILEFISMEESAGLAAAMPFFTRGRNSNHLQLKKMHWTKTLFDAIDRGQEDSVKKMLDKLEASHPQRLEALLSSKITYTDHAGRMFYNITPLQFAAWNLDKPMRDLLRKYMTETEVALQIDALDKNGIDYSMLLSDFKRLAAIAPEHAPPIQHNAETLECLESKNEEQDSDKHIVLNEKHYDWSFRIFKSALQTYIDAVTPMIQNGKYNWALLEELWLHVGFTQRYLTVPWVNAYCCNTRFDPQPNFNTVTPDRKTTFYNWITDKTQDFFDFLDNLGLGFSFGIYKGPAEGAARGDAAVRYWDAAPRRPLDLAALSHLCEVRVDDYKALIEDIQLALSRPAARF